MVLQIMMIKRTVKISCSILFCFLFIRCSSYRIETLKAISRYSGEGYDTAVFRREKQYLTKKQIKEFEHHGLHRRDKNFFKIYNLIFYTWVNDTILVKDGEGYYYFDGAVGKEIYYYPDGKISEERNYIIINDSTREVISMEDFNKIKNKRNGGDSRYSFQPDGTWKYYSKEGKLIKEEKYVDGIEVK